MSKTVVVTGATSGIGKILTQAFAAQGYKVFAGYRNLALKYELLKMSELVIPFRIDMSKKWTITEAAKFISENTENIDTLVNMAGCVVAGPVECLSVDKIREQFEVNTFSHLEFTQKLLPKLNNAKIINISSMASFGFFPFVSPYCASKRALDILFNSLQVEYNNTSEFLKIDGDSLDTLFNQQETNRKKISVISIKPGVIKTPLWEKSIEANKSSLEECEKYKQEAEMLIKNAQKNAKKGLNPIKVVELILKVEKSEKPKPSYTVGFDAKCAEIMSHMPQSWINILVSLGLKLKTYFNK